MDPKPHAMNDRAADVEIRRLRGEMDVTRAKLAHTIEELEDRLNPRTVVARARQGARDRARHIAGQARDRAAGAASRVVQQAGRVSVQVQDRVQAFGVGRSAAVAAGVASALATWRVRQRRHRDDYVTDGPVAQMIAEQAGGGRRHSRTAVLLGIVALASTGAVLSRLRQHHAPGASEGPSR
jgi:hypothetical protein